MYFKAKQV